MAPRRHSRSQFVKLRLKGDRLDSIPSLFAPSRWRPVETGGVEVIDFSLFWAVGAGVGEEEELASVRKQCLSAFSLSCCVRDLQFLRARH